MDRVLSVAASGGLRNAARGENGPAPPDLPPRRFSLRRVSTGRILDTAVLRERTHPGRLMLTIQKDKNRLATVERLQLAPQLLDESVNLRALISNSADEFLDEIGERLFVIGTGVAVAQASSLTADIVGLDAEGCAVIGVIDNGRGGPPPLFRAITCAGLVSSWKEQDFFRPLDHEQVERLEKFLPAGKPLNHAQRVLLIAEQYSFDVLAAAEWLGTRHGIDIGCVRAATFRDKGSGRTFFTGQRILPTAEAASAPTITSIDGQEIELSETRAASELEVLTQRLVDETSSRQRAEEAFQASEARYRILSKLSPVGIFHTDATGNFLYVNERWCDIGGVETQTALGQGWARVIHPDDRDRVLHEWAESIDRGTPFKSEYRCLRNDGGTSWILSEASVQGDETGKVIGYVGTMTELHRTESEHRADAASADSRTVAHDRSA